MDLTGWSLAIALAKWLGHLALVSIAGSLLVEMLLKDSPAWLIRLRGHAAALGLTATVLFGFLQLGSLNEMGIQGMFDRELASMLLPTPMGLSIIAKALLFACVLLLCQRRWVVQLCILLLAVSSTMTGHLADAPWPYQLILVGHLLLISCWVGSLYPLYRVTCDLTVDVSYPVLHRFGWLMQWILAVLLCSGVAMVWYLWAGQWPEDWSGYALMLAAKITLVLLLMLQGAWHKWRLVPELQRGKTQLLVISLRMETALGLSILLLTSFLTSITGPFNA